MAYGNNRAGGQPRSHFRQAGGSVIKFRHPYFAGAIDNPNGEDLAIDEIDISKCCKLEGRFFEANQNQDSAKQVVMVDSSTVTITNKMLNGTITIPAVPTTGDVATGDFIAGCQLIQSVGDNIGGVITKTDFVNGKAQTKVYYGVTVLRCPTDVSEGNDVPVYNVQLLYSGWIQAESTSSELNKKAIWAVGSKKGLKGIYSPYTIQNAEGDGGTGTKPLDASTALAPNGDSTLSDKVDEGADNSGEVSENGISAFTTAGILSDMSVVDETNTEAEGATANTDASGGSGA